MKPNSGFISVIGTKFGYLNRDQETKDASVANAYIYLQPRNLVDPTQKWQYGLFRKSSLACIQFCHSAVLFINMASLAESTDELDLSKGMTGSCLCGSITVILNQDIFSKPNGHICYCESCRKSTGTTGLNSLSTIRDKVEIRDPKSLIKTYVDSDTDSGRSVERHFCSNCGG